MNKIWKIQCQGLGTGIVYWEGMLPVDFSHELGVRMRKVRNEIDEDELLRWEIVEALQ